MISSLVIVRNYCLSSYDQIHVYLHWNYYRHHPNTVAGRMADGTGKFIVVSQLALRRYLGTNSMMPIKHCILTCSIYTLYLAYSPTF